MGGKVSKEAEIYFAEVARDAKEPDEKVFADHLLRSKQDLCSGAELFHFALPILGELIPSCITTHRIRWLFRFCLKQLDHSSCNYTQGPDDVLLAALHITEFVVRYAHRVSCGNTAKLLRLILGDAESDETNPLAPPHSGENEIKKFCEALMEYCVRVPLTTSTVEAHREAVTLLLSMSSSPLYHSTTFDEDHMDTFTEAIMASEGLSAFLAVMLERLVQWGFGRLPAKPLLYHSGYLPSFRNLYNVLGGRGNQKSIGSGDSLGRHSAQLLSVLVSHQKGNGSNPALDYMVGIQENERAEFRLILTAMANKLQECPALCIVLYVLVYDHPTFLHTVMTAHPKELLDILQGVLHLSYTASTEPSKTIQGVSSADSYTVSINEKEFSDGDMERMMRSMKLFSYPFVSFMTSTLLLLFSQDQILNKLISDTSVIPRFTIDRHVGSLPISAQCIIVLTHGVVKALNERNEPLAAVFIPSLSNLAPFIHDVDSFTSQRLMKLLSLTVRKLRRAATPVKHSELAMEGVITSEEHNGELEVNDPQGADMFLRQLEAIVEAVEGMLQGEDRKNDSLVYELLYNRASLTEGFSANSPQPRMRAAHKALRPLLRIVDFYETELASVTSAESYKDILAVIRRVTLEQAGAAPQSITPVLSRNSRHDQLKAREVLFVYEESAHSYDFFGPFVWSTLMSDATHPGGVLWATSTTALPMFPE